MDSGAIRRLSLLVKLCGTACSRHTQHLWLQPLRSRKPSDSRAVGSSPDRAPTHEGHVPSGANQRSTISRGGVCLSTRNSQSVSLRLQSETAEVNFIRERRGYGEIRGAESGFRGKLEVKRKLKVKHGGQRRSCWLCDHVTHQRVDKRRFRGTRSVLIPREFQHPSCFLLLTSFLPFTLPTVFLLSGFHMLSLSIILFTRSLRACV